MRTLPDGWLAILGCPKCSKEIWASEEDPDAAMGDMWNHLYWEHSGLSKDVTGQLLAQIREVAKR